MHFISTEFGFLVLELKYTPCDFHGTKSKSKNHHVSSKDIILYCIIVLKLYLKTLAPSTVR